MTWKASFAIAAITLLLASQAAAQTPGGATGPGGSGPGAPSTPGSGTPVSPSSPTTPGRPGAMNPPVPGAPGAATPGTSTPGTNVPGRGRDLGLPCPAGQSRPTGSSMCTPVPPGSPVSPPSTR